LLCRILRFAEGKVGIVGALEAAPLSGVIVGGYAFSKHLFEHEDALSLVADLTAGIRIASSTV
jgi:hypothetical protein